MRVMRREVTWEDGATWWWLAERYLGDGGRWTELVAANPGVCPVDVPVGTVLRVPGPGVVEPL